MNQKKIAKKETEKEFVKRGLSIIKVFSANFIKLPFLKFVIAIPQSVYERILRAAYIGDDAHMKTGRKDGSNRDLKFDKKTMLFTDADDGRFLFPIEMLPRGNINDSNNFLSVFAAEMERRLEKGEDLNIFQYNEDNEYIGGLVEGKLVSPDGLQERYIPKN